MDSYDPNLILDLAAGRLPEEEARTAEASLSAEGRAELAAQRAILAAIADSPPVAMTDIERAHLHRAVGQGIAETTREMSAAAVATQTRARPPRQRTVWLTRIASAAAVAAMFVGVVAVGSQLAGGGDDADVSADFATVATTVASAAGAEAAQTTTALAATDSDSTAGDEGADGGADSPLGDDVVEESVAQLATAPSLDRAVEKEDLGEVRLWLETNRISLPPVENLQALPCFEVASEDDDLAIAYSFNIEYQSAGGDTLAGIAYADAGTPTEDPLIRVYDLATCEPVLATTD